jgi:hypothetical protein
VRRRFAAMAASGSGSAVVGERSPVTHDCDRGVG